jgi:hypothetical protein
MNLKLLVGLAVLGSLVVAVLTAQRDRAAGLHAMDAAQSLPELRARCGNDAVALLARQRRLDIEAGRTPTVHEEGFGSRYDQVNNYSESMKGCFILIRSWNR